MEKVNSREELKTLRQKYKDNVIMRLVSDNAKDRVEIYVAIGDCGLKSGARDIMKVIFDEVNAKRLEKVSVIAMDCVNGCDKPDAPKVEGNFACGHDPTVDVIFPGEATPTRHGKVNADMAKKIVADIAARLEGK
ncbi:MAG: hypothetical protein FWB87_04395 [Defluviitaleaceae bacterium]|nr:hypothetical protein [Defluviitaleaceae bacterium]